MTIFLPRRGRVLPNELVPYRVVLRRDGPKTVWSLHAFDDRIERVLASRGLLWFIIMHGCGGSTLTRPRSRVTIAKTRRSGSVGENTGSWVHAAALLAEQDRARRG